MRLLRNIALVTTGIIHLLPNQAAAAVSGPLKVGAGRVDITPDANAIPRLTPLYWTTLSVAYLAAYWLRGSCPDSGGGDCTERVEYSRYFSEPCWPPFCLNRPGLCRAGPNAGRGSVNS